MKNRAARAGLVAFLAASGFTMVPERAGAQGAPGTDVLMQTLEKRLLALKPQGMSERTVLFGAVLAGKPAGSKYPFRVTLSVRDYGPGYPPNKYYGETCVGQITEWTYDIVADAFGTWQVEGAMTPESKTCKPNPAEGVSSMPLAGLAGTRAPGGPTNHPAPDAVPSAAVAATGTYECNAGGQALPLMTFTIRDASHYVGADSKPGTFTFDAKTTRIVFKGGSLDGVTPTGFYWVYRLDHGRPTFSVLNASGRDAETCERG
ncbi:MAG TPA: hypothetical protein VE967_18895 [Gemmatimonadaceae bacterium]|nr:hypothetical protein [Gemmatimonadaceae bacterium]